jgi:HSP20 family protein
MLLRFDPFRELDRMTDEVAGRAERAVPMDAVRRGDQVVVWFDLPGVDPASIDLEAERNVLTLSAQRRTLAQDGDAVLARERRQGTFRRQLFLGDTLDPGRVEASYHDGVLTLSIPVAETAKPRKVSIEGVESQTEAIEAEATSA